MASSNKHNQQPQNQENQTPERLWYPEKPAWLDRDPGLLKLEVGAQGSAGFNRFDLYYAGVTIVTVDAPEELEARGSNGFGPYSSFDDTSAYSEVEIREHLARRGHETPAGAGYHHEAIEADGRRLGFEDNTFSDVLFCNVVGDPSIRDRDVEALINEAFRVGQRLIIKEEFTPFIAEERLENSNLKEAGFDLVPYFIPDDGVFPNQSVVMMKVDKENSTPFRIMTREEQKSAEWQAMIERNEQARRERKAARRRARAERKYNRRLNRSKGWMGRMGLVKPPVKPEHHDGPTENN